LFGFGGGSVIIGSAILSERTVHLTAFNPVCASDAAALYVSPVAVRIAKGDDWVDLAPPGSFG
jgi:hypothetical protein